MRVVYDKQADAAYIYLMDKKEKGQVKKTITMNENVILDFDADKKLIGIEILSASKIVPKQAVAAMQTE
ncbi:MAG: DUF2283 domain-containing protein [archaeon]